MADLGIRQYISMESCPFLCNSFSTNTSFCLTWRCSDLKKAKDLKVEIRRHRRKIDSIIYIAQFMYRASEGPMKPIQFDLTDNQFFNLPLIVNLFEANQLAWVWRSLLLTFYEHMWEDLPLVVPLMAELQRKAFIRGIIKDPSYTIEICELRNQIYLQYTFDLDFKETRPLRYIPLIPTLRERAKFADSVRPEKLWDKSQFWKDHTERVEEAWENLTPAERAAFEQNLTL